MDAPGTPLSGSLYVSPPIEAMFGYPAEAWLKDGFFGSVVHPDDRDRVVTAYTPEEEDSFSGEYRIIATDGRTVWVSRDDASLVRDEHGQPAYVLGFFVDVTAQNEAAAEVRRQKAYFESLVAISPAAVVTMDRDERVTGWNPAAERLFGYAPEEAIGRRIDELVMDTDAMREEGAGVAREAVETGRASRLSRRTRKGGGSVDVEITMVPLVVDGSHTGFYAVYHDITELQAARRDAEAATHAKSVFLASMSHEIRTPMNAVIGMSGLLLDTEQTPEQEEYARIIRTSGESLLAIINDILDFSKIEAGRMELETAPFDLVECLESALDLTAGRARRRAGARQRPPPDLRAIVGDDQAAPDRPEPLSNAIKFTIEARSS
jgi:PAS domain S-box-containing protein